MLELTKSTYPPAPQMGTGRLNFKWKRILFPFHSQAVSEASYSRGVSFDDPKLVNERAKILAAA